MLPSLYYVAQHALLTVFMVGLVFTVSFLLYARFFYVDFPKVQGLPEIPNGSLLAGHLYALGQDHANTLHQWSSKYGWPVFQARMGYRRAVFLNSYDVAQEWICKNHSSTADRPWFHTFHGVVSATSGWFNIFQVAFFLLFHTLLTIVR